MQAVLKWIVELIKQFVLELIGFVAFFFFLVVLFKVLQ